LKLVFDNENFSFAYETALNESLGLQSAILVTEFGCGTNDDEELLIPTIDSQDKAMIPGIIWPWKNNCFQQGCETSWSLYDSGISNGTFATQNGPERPNRVRIISRIHPRNVIGQLKQYLYNSTTASFTMTANCDNKTALLTNNETVIYIPRRLTSSIVNVTGAATLKTIVTNPDQSRLAIINPTCTGEYHVAIVNSTDQLKTLTNHQSIVQYHDRKQSMKDAYELFRVLHETAVKIGRTFSEISSNFISKTEALRYAIQLHSDSIRPIIDNIHYKHRK